MIHCQAFYDVNLSPVPAWQGAKQLQPPAQGLMKQAGFRPAFGLYEWTINRAGQADWQGNDPSTSLPPKQEAVQRCAALAAPTGIPLWFDVESQTPSPQDIVNALGWAHDSSNYSEIWWYMAPAPWGGGPRPHTTDLLSRAVPTFYCDGMDAVDINNWFSKVVYMTRWLDQNYSGLPRVAFLQPIYATWDQPANPMNQKTVPIELWRKMIPFLVERDYDLFLWTGEILPSLQVLAQVRVIQAYLY